MQCHTLKYQTAYLPEYLDMLEFHVNKLNFLCKFLLYCTAMCGILLLYKYFLKFHCLAVYGSYLTVLNGFALLNVVFHCFGFTVLYCTIGNCIVK